jgi:hypothetical protein
MSADASAPTAAAHPIIRILDWLNVLVMLALAVFLASFAVRNSDFWLHLSAGRLIADGAYPFGVDPFSALDPAPVWINHAWFYDLLIYLIERRAGGMGVVIAKAVLVALLTAVMIGTRRRGSERWLPAILTSMALLAMAPRLLMQSTVVSFLLLGVLLWVLQREPRQTNRWQLPVSVAIVFALWVNLDGGFLFGLVALVLWMIGGMLQSALPFGSARTDSLEREVAPSARALVVAAAVCACLINPYGFKVFTLPSDWAFLLLPPGLRTDELFRELFRSPLEKDYLAAVAGVIPGGAYFVLLGLGLGSFVLNTPGWRWDRALIWLAFAGASLWLARLIPFFAVVAGPITVLNLQAAFAKRSDRQLDARARFARAFLGGFGRFATLLAGLGLLALAWPGGLAKDAGTMLQERRVAWTLAPDESSVLAAKELAACYESGKLRSSDARGFHLPFQFGYYCAWYCPQEKILFDVRMTAPSLAGPYAATRRAFLALRDRTDVVPELPVPHPTHIVLAGPITTILSRGILFRNDCFPLWGIRGQSLIAGWCGADAPDVYPAMRLDPVKLAATEPKTPAPTAFADPLPLTAWDRYRAAPKPIPAESHEAALWLVARDAAGARAASAISASQIAAGIGRSAPLGPSDLVNRLWDPFVVGQFTQGLVEAAWQKGPDGRLARVAPLLAIRAARRGIAINPDDYEVYMRLVAAYELFDGDQELTAWRQSSFNQLQQITAARQSLARLPLASSYGQFTAVDELALQNVLVHHYQRLPVIEGLEVQPVDLMLEASSRIVDLEPLIYARRRATIPANQATDFEKAFENDRRQKTERLAKLQQDVKRRSDEYETRAAKLSPGERAKLAVRFGLAREALNVLRSADPSEMTPPNVELLLHLLLLAGEADDAYSILHGPSFNPITVLPAALQPTFRALNLRTAAALGDMATAIDEFKPLIEGQPASFAPPLVGTLQWLVFPDLGASPLTRGITTPLWFGMFPKEGQGAKGQLLQMQDAVQQYCNNIVRQGLLALEYSDVPFAQLRFKRALEVAGPFPFVLRPQAVAWSRLFRDTAADH